MSLGQQLREARQRKNLTTSQVAAATRMKVQVVEAIENDDFRRMAAPIYVKGFIRMYAEFVGMDARPLIDEFMARNAGGGPTPSLIAPTPARVPHPDVQEAVERHQQEYGVYDEFVVHPKDDAAVLPAPAPAAEPAAVPQPAAEEPDLFSIAQKHPPQHPPPRAREEAVPKAEPQEAPPAPAPGPEPAGPAWPDKAAELYGDVRNVVARLGSRAKDRLPQPGGFAVSPRVIAVAVVLIVLLIFLFSGVMRRPRKPEPVVVPPHAQKGEELRLAVPVPDPYVE